MSVFLDPLAAVDGPPIEAPTAEVVVPQARPARGFFDEALADSPWHVRDLVRLVTRYALGGGGILLAYAVAADSVVWRTQVIWTAVAAGAAALAVVGSVLWLLAGMGAIARERGEVKRLLRARAATRRPRTAAVEAEAALVASPAMHKYHRPTCDLARDKAVRPLTARQIASRKLEPCGMCQP